MVGRTEFFGQNRLFLQVDHISKPVAQGQYVVSDTRCPALHDREGKQGSGPEGDEVL